MSFNCQTKQICQQNLENKALSAAFTKFKTESLVLWSSLPEVPLSQAKKVAQKLYKMDTKGM